MSRRQQTLNSQVPPSTSGTGAGVPEDDAMTGLVDLVNNIYAGSGLEGPNNQGKFETVTIRPKEIVCDLLPMEMVTKKGIVLQFLNQNSQGATSMIGVSRIGLNDPRRIPAYLMRNLGVIRQHAVRALQVHFRLTLCSTGVLETLNPEDYSISFSWASLSEFGRSLAQYNRPDLGIGYGVCDGVLQPIRMSKTDPEPVYVLNVHIQLQDPAKRSTVVLKRAREEAAAKAHPPAAKRQNKGSNSSSGGNFSQRIANDAADLVMKRAIPVTFDQVYPVLPVGQGPTVGPNWPKGGVGEMPDNY
jgi:hypothetical protein